MPLPLALMGASLAGNTLAGLLGGQRRIDPKKLQGMYMGNYEDILRRLPQLNTKGMYAQGRATAQRQQRIGLGQQYSRFRKMMGPGAVSTAELGAGARARR